MHGRPWAWGRARGATVGYGAWILGKRTLVPRAPTWGPPSQRSRCKRRRRSRAYCLYLGSRRRCCGSRPRSRDRTRRWRAPCRPRHPLLRHRRPALAAVLLEMLLEMLEGRHPFRSRCARVPRPAPPRVRASRRATTLRAPQPSSITFLPRTNDGASSRNLTTRRAGRAHSLNPVRSSP